MYRTKFKSNTSILDDHFYLYFVWFNIRVSIMLQTFILK